MVVEMQSGFTEHFHIFDALIACNSNAGFIQFLIKTEQVVSLEE